MFPVEAILIEYSESEKKLQMCVVFRRLVGRKEGETQRGRCHQVLGAAALVLRRGEERAIGNG